MKSSVAGENGAAAKTLLEGTNLGLATAAASGSPAERPALPGVTRPSMYTGSAAPETVEKVQKVLVRAQWLALLP